MDAKNIMQGDSYSLRRDQGSIRPLMSLLLSASADWAQTVFILLFTPLHWGFRQL